MYKIFYRLLFSMILLFGVNNSYSAISNNEISSIDSSESILSVIQNTQYGNFILIVFILLFILLLTLIAIVISKMRRKKSDYICKMATGSMLQLLKSMPNMVVVYDKNLVIEDIINPQEDLLKLFGNDSLIGNTLDDLAKKHPCFVNAANVIYNNVKHTKETGEECYFNYEIEMDGVIYNSESKSAIINNGRVLCFAKDVSASIVAKKEVVKLKNFSQLILDNLPVAVFVKDVKADYRSIFNNENLLEFYGNNTKLEDGYLVSDSMNSEMADKYREEDMLTFSSDVPLVFNRVFCDKNGNIYRYGMVTKRKLVTEDGCVYILATLVDTTEIRRNEIELENARNEISIALDAGSLSAWHYDVQKRIFSSLYGETVSGIVSTFEDIRDILHPESQQVFDNFMQSIIDGGVKTRRAVLRFKRDDSYGWYETYASGICSQNGDGVTQIVGTQKDITSEIMRQHELKESNFKFDLIIKSSGIVQWDYDYTTNSFISPDPTSFMHENITMKEYLSHVVEDDKKIVVDSMEQMAHGMDDRMNVQIRLNTPIGIRWYDIDGVVLERDKNGKAMKLTGFRRDITNFKNMTNELIVLRDKAEEANRLKSAFLANMSHEIRTPLNAIVGFSNLVAQSDDKVEKEEFCKIIETNNELLLQLINDILDLSKIEAGQLEFIFAEMDVSDMLFGLEHIFKYRIKEGVELVVNVPTDSCIICSERNRLTQVMVNFLSNAYKFTSHGSITMGYEYIKTGLKFYVSDTGKGIATENINAVFERFAKFDNFVQGTGLGLSICKTIVSKLGGEIGVNSKEGQGTTFWFTLPCQILNESEIVEHDADLNNIAVKKNSDMKTILIAEDNNSNYMLLYNIFRKKYNVVHALNGVEAVKLHSTINPDVIFMDVKMPVMDGFEATHIIRESDKNIPIIALTAHAYDNDRERAKEMGCSEFMTKPIDVKMLMNYLDRLFNGCL